MLIRKKGSKLKVMFLLMATEDQNSEHFIFWPDFKGCTSVYV